MAVNEDAFSKKAVIPFSAASSPGVFVLKRLIRGESVEAIATAMADTYDTTPKIISQDIDRFLQFIRDLDLIDPA